MRRLAAPLCLVVIAAALGIFVLAGGSERVAAAPGGSLQSAIAATAKGADASSTSTDSPRVAAGQALFVANCSTCHGVNATGSDHAPNLVGVGAATVDLWVSTGWMPLSDPTVQPIRKPPRFTRPQVLEIVAYVTSLGKSSLPGIPTVDLTGADLAQGFSLFTLNCAPCHTVTGAGDALASGYSAPSLHGVNKTEVAEAIRTGPGTMPQFGPGTVTTSQLKDIVAYVTEQIEHPNDPGGFYLGGVGPVAEGFIGLFVGVGACMLVAFWIGDRTERDEDEHGHGHGDPASPHGAEHV